MKPITVILIFASIIVAWRVWRDYLWPLVWIVFWCRDDILYVLFDDSFSNSSELKWYSTIDIMCLVERYRKRSICMDLKDYLYKLHNQGFLDHLEMRHFHFWKLTETGFSRGSEISQYR